MSHFDTLNWEEVIADATARLDWVAGQSADPDVQSMLLQQAGDGAAVEAIPLPPTVAAERRQAIGRERLARTLGQVKAGRWASRETGAPVGTFDPAQVTAREAAGVLVVVRRYVARHASPWSRYPLSPEGQDDAVSRIIHAIWTRDYARSNLGAGNLAGAVWQACSLYRRTAWIGESALERKAARRASRHEGEAGEWLPAGRCDNPARIAAAIEAATLGLSAPVVLNRGRAKVGNRNRPRKTMPAVSAADAREALVG